MNQVDAGVPLMPYEAKEDKEKLAGYCSSTVAFAAAFNAKRQSSTALLMLMTCWRRQHGALHGVRVGQGGHERASALWAMEAVGRWCRGGGVAPWQRSGRGSGCVLDAARGTQRVDGGLRDERPGSVSRPL
ncbi:hypothetical protein ACLOJK_022442 [Asimina triloba]